MTDFLCRGDSPCPWNPVPEPWTLGLIVLGLVLAWAILRRRP